MGFNAEFEFPVLWCVNLISFFCEFMIIENIWEAVCVGRFRRICSGFFHFTHIDLKVVKEILNHEWDVYRR